MGKQNADTKQRYWKTSVGLVRKTTPFLILNMVVYAGFFLATVLWLGLFGGLAVVTAERLPILAYVFVFIAVVIPGGLLRLARRYILYLVKGAHIAVITKLLVEGELPGDRKQVEYGREIVKENFRDVSILFALDRIIDGVVRSFTNSFVRIVDILPLGGAVSQVARIIAQIIRRSLSYIDEAILSYAIALNEENVWRSGRHGLILYAQSYKPILATAVRIWLVGRVLFIGALVVGAIPGFLLLGISSSIGMQIAVVVGVILFAHLTVLAVFEPFAMAYTMVTYHGAIKGQVPNAEWDQRLQKVSKKFRELVGKAREGAEPDPLDTAPVPATSDATQPGAPTGQPAAQPALSTGSRGNGPGGLTRGGGMGMAGLIGKAAQGLANQATQATQAQNAPPVQPPADPAQPAQAAPAAPAPAAPAPAPPAADSVEGPPPAGS